MTGFSYKNSLLQIIHGSLIIITLIFLYWEKLLPLIDFFKPFESTTVVVFLFASFIIGVIIDFIADISESLVIRYYMTPPVFYLLKGRKCGITLAHHDLIREELIDIASEHKVKESDKVTTKDLYTKLFEGKNIDLEGKEKINYLLQVAKNKAFRVCREYQKEQIDSFFVLYIFSRNISVSLLLSIALLLVCSYFAVSAFLFAMMLITLASSYRYYLYYARILLGATHQKEEDKYTVSLSS